MSLASVIGKIFGSKAERDYKAVKPILERILAVYPEIDALSADELRARSAALRQQLREVEAPFERRIEEIRAELDKDIPVSEKVKLAEESDKLVKDEDEAIEKALKRNSAGGVRDSEVHRPPLQGERDHRGRGQRL